MESKVRAMLGLILALAMVLECVKCHTVSLDSCNRDGNGSIECETDDLMDTELYIRQLAGGRKAISYEAIRHNAIPCSRPGRSYYNCNGRGKQANPYTRGCTTMTHCRRIYE
ncbi:Protein RALF-like 19 [Hibiscus syriacus]|uniref:Protein RALF-like 19 n=1 Tax=Hibiscus syriacus TaxID=106335 RepID=A0A6A3AWX2_HIBSY|nr:protein RALF-like 19 [Hibiscus syriacus]KAE8709101.1 Protein RALF-like 19 [Hibiscus syriacus]